MCKPSTGPEEAVGEVAWCAIMKMQCNQSATLFLSFFSLSFSFLLAGFVSHTLVQLSFKGTTGRFTHQVHKQGRTI